MKNLKYILVLGLFVVGALQSCKKDFVEGYDIDPNRPLDVSMDVLLAGSEIYTTYVTSGDMARITNVVMQQMTGSDRQFLAINRYVIAGSDFETMWEFNAYAGAMKDLKILMDKAKEQGAPHYEGVAQILMALNLSTLTDAFGDIPYSEALVGTIDSGLEPAYDSQQAIYSSIDQLLDNGIANVGAASSVLSPGGEDFFFGGDLAMWTKFANSLKARNYSHLSNTGDYDADIMAAVAAGFGAGEGCLPTFGSAQPQSNPWGNFLSQRDGYITFEGSMIDGMTSRNDTLRRNEFQNASGFYFQFTSPVVVSHNFELLFIEAETMLRMGATDADVQAKLEEAVAAHFAMIGVSSADYIANDLVDLASLASTEEKHEAVMWEKYVASYTTNEGWNDYKRTGFPALTPVADAQGGIDVPQRFPYPQSEYLYNPNTPSAVEEFPASLTTPVWWAE